MKEFVMKHPIITFLLADSAIAGAVKIVQCIVDAFTGGHDTTVTIGPVEAEIETEDETNETAGDIQ